VYDPRTNFAQQDRGTIVVTTKPEFLVFYAWQSDHPGNHNRYFIQESAALAAERLNSDPSCPFRIRIDQDTQGVPGLCDIPATILSKIESSDAFLCDLTYVAQSVGDGGADDDFQPRYCSNPNVLFELGYAFRALGPERIVCVMNEYYGPATEQIFDIAHRRFPLTYCQPDSTASRKEVSERLSKAIAEAISAMFPLGRRGDADSVARTIVLREQFESSVREGTFHGLTRRNAAITIAVIPGRATTISHDDLQKQHIPPPGKREWNPELRGSSVLSVVEADGERFSLAEMRMDGVILAADTWLLELTKNRANKLIVPPNSLESMILSATCSYLDVLKNLNAPPPWTICISIIEVRGYEFHLEDSHEVPRLFPDVDICADPIVIQEIPESLDRQKVAQILRPAFDYIWREFGFTGSLNYTRGGIYNNRY
jgi:hypothetical protein